MKKSLFILPAVLLMMASCSSDDPITPDIPETPDTPESPEIPDNPDQELEVYRIELTQSEQTAMNSIDEFSHKFMCEMAMAKGDEAYSCSPVSAAIYLSMMANAAGGDTRTQLLNALEVTDLETLNSLNAKLMKYLPCEGYGSSLSINNAFWVADRFTVNDIFRNAIVENYQGNVEYVDFSNSATVPAINRWVSDKTNGLIPCFLSGGWESYIDKDMVSANTVYFRGKWNQQFDKANTKEETFHGVNGDVKVSMMHQVIESGYAKNDIAQLVVKDFKDGFNYVEFYLPAEGEDIKAFTAKLTPAEQNKLRKAAKTYDVTLALPSFKAENEERFNNVLAKLGVNTANFDFSGMGLQPAPLGTLQITSIKMDEEGAEMAAVTGGWTSSDLPEEYPSVTVTFNRPYLYIVRNHKTNAILMAGTVVE